MRELSPGMGRAVAERTVLRKVEGEWESWGDVADRVAWGNVSLAPGGIAENIEEYAGLRDHIANGRILMSGRHLQHGDGTQKYRNMEMFTNCFDGETKILTVDRGTRKLKELVGESVLVMAGDGHVRQATINSHGKQRVQEISLRPLDSAGKFRHKVSATKNHRWLLRGGMWTQDIKEGDIVSSWNRNVSENVNNEARVHGLLFGDGTAHKTRKENKTAFVSQGRSYATIRVCGDSTTKEEAHLLLDGEGYKYTQPPHADGDRVYYCGKIPYVKQVPTTQDPQYVYDFIHGWWLADGSKGVGRAKEISTANEEAAMWLLDNAGYAGYAVTMHRVMKRTSGDGSYPNGKPLHVIRLREGVEWKVTSITEGGEVDVFCPEEPVTRSFVLGNGIVTGNCSTACTSALSLQLLLQGSGVGRCYDDGMMVVDWDKAPDVLLLLGKSHLDVSEEWGLDRQIAVECFMEDPEGSEHIYHTVEDSREGWAKALELYETMTYLGQSDKVLVLDFSNVRPKGAPIGGMQGRPSSGPVPLMQAFKQVRDEVVGKGMPLWKQAMFVDHFMADAVLVGGVRRAARIATKYWKDPDILEFINIKKDGGLWSANNSVGVDEEFWDGVSKTLDMAHMCGDFIAKNVFKAITSASYYDGEPGFLNLHKLNFSEEGLDWEELKKGEYVGSKKYQVSDDYKKLLGDIAGRVEHKKWKAIVNPCGEIVLNVLGGFCVIADVVPYHCKDQEEFEDAVRAATRALIRVNTMDSIYSLEVQRTNRIGVGVTGIHEWLWDQHHTSFSQISADDSKHVFRCLTNARRVAERSAVDYSAALGKSSPHTVTTIKPAGTTSKLFGLTEGCHLPAMPYYMRWVQKRSDDPLVKEYADRGYPTKELSTYKGMTAVGFPTKPLITDLIPEDKLVCAGEATMEEQFAWLRLLEENWLGPDKGNQISYTLKFSPDKVSLQEFQQQMLEVQNVRCVSVLPQADISVYEYLPEEAITKEQYEEYMSRIQQTTEDISREHVECGAGGCPVDFSEGDK